MQFVLANEKKTASFCVEKEALSGVKKIIDKVISDVCLVTDKTPVLKEKISDCSIDADVVMIATDGYSEYLKVWEEQGIIDLTNIRGKREVYSYSFIKVEERNVLLIAGSDKRGTIYGAFHLSDLLEVSAWVYFADVLPEKKETVVFDESIEMVSKEPSVKYRGIFINDEYPAFGNWTQEKFGGYTAKMYDHVFELILRLKGNYLWPAMWVSNFSLEGPGLENAILADEYGIVMSNSHHEPCLRHSEEWDLVKGENTPYGTEWNFDRNKEGLKAYWKDGLLRNGKFENIITMGMRGERDSEILGHEAGLKENIQYLKDVLVTQNQLIKENVCEDLSQVPRMIALYKEVEAYYYGDENTPGLKGYEELDGVTLMLCEDNFGNMRYLPTLEERNHRGGYGMYYHFDYHGSPVSYEWVNSTELSKVWEQMTMAYESGVSEIWIVNVGDLKPQELPISFFLDLAYDYEKYGINTVNATENYIKEWVKKQFKVSFEPKDMDVIYELVSEYTRLNSIYKPEAQNPDTFHPLHDREADTLIKKANDLMKKADDLLKTLTDKIESMGKNILKDQQYAAFYELVYYPVVASMNVLRWNLYGSKNHYYASLGAVLANDYAEKMTTCDELDESLKKTYHSVMDGRWNHMMNSEHVGFINWNDEDARLPLRCLVDTKRKPRMIVSTLNETGYSIGTEWTDKNIHFYHFLDPKCDKIDLSIVNGTKVSFDYTLSCDDDWIGLSKKSGTVDKADVVDITLNAKDRTTIPSKDGIASSIITVKSAFAIVYVHVYVLTDASNLQKKNYVPAIPASLQVKRSYDYLKLVLEADEFVDIENGKEGTYQILKPFGKYESGIKVMGDFCSLHQFDDMKLTYEMELMEDMDIEVAFHFAPSNPIHKKETQRIRVSFNGEKEEVLQSVSDTFAGGDTSCMEWCKGVIVNEHIAKLVKSGHAGKNHITIRPLDPGVVLERIVVRQKK